MAPIAISDDIKQSPIHVSTDIKRFNNEDSATVDLVLRQFRCLIADLCQQFNGGHPG